MTRRLHYGKESKKMNNFFSHNLPWKLVSLALATMMWIFVINTQNPLQPKEITNIPVNIRGISELEDKGFVIQNEEELRNTKVRVVVRGQRLQVEKLKANPKLIDATLDLTPYISTLNSETESSERLVAFAVNPLIEGISVEEVRPKTIYVTFEKEKEVTKNIDYVVGGATNSTYTALEPIIKPNTVELRGPKTKIESIAKVVVEINVDDFSEDVLSDTLPIKVLDKEGKEITGIQKSPQAVEITLPIGKKKKVPLETQFTGVLPPGYIQTNTIISPKEITIVGKQNIVDQIQSIKLSKISLENMIQSDTIQAEFILPEGIKYIDNIENKAFVTVEIQKENSHQYTVDTNKLIIEATGLGEGYTYEMLDESFNLVLIGTAENLLQFKPDAIKCKLNLTGYAEGEYSIPITLDMPENLKIVNTPTTLNIRIVPVETENTEEEVVETVNPNPDTTNNNSTPNNNDSNNTTTNGSTTDPNTNSENLPTDDTSNVNN